MKPAVFTSCSQECLILTREGKKKRKVKRQRKPCSCLSQIYILLVLGQGRLQQQHFPLGKKVLNCIVLESNYTWNRTRLYYTGKPLLWGSSVPVWYSSIIVNNAQKWTWKRGITGHFNVKVNIIIKWYRIVFHGCIKRLSSLFYWADSTRIW